MPMGTGRNEPIGVASREPKYQIIVNSLSRLTDEVEQLSDFLDSLDGTQKNKPTLEKTKLVSPLNFKEIYENIPTVLYELSERLAKIRNSLTEILI